MTTFCFYTLQFSVLTLSYVNWLLAVASYLSYKDESDIDLLIIIIGKKNVL